MVQVLSLIKLLGGSIAKAYYELLKELWMGSSSVLSPWDFRQIFVGFVKQFAGFTQHDSHEMLAFMLDALHEDLNRVKDKPYFELKEKERYETEEEASRRWWQSHLQRENSIIVDLLHGQYKSIIHCPGCHRISITYDPFMYLGLPIPHGQYKIIFKYFPLNIQSKDPYQHFELEMIINDNTTLKDMKNKIRSECGRAIQNLEGILTSGKFFKKRLSDNNNILPYYENGYEVVIYETELSIESKDVVTFYILPMQFVEEKSFMGIKSKMQCPIFYSKPFTFAKSMRVRELYLFLFKYYRKIIPDFDSRTYEKFLENNRNANYVNEEFSIYFKQKNIPFQLHIINNIQTSYSYSNNQTCEFCDRNCDFCPFEFPLDTPLENLFQRQKTKRPFLLSLELLMYNENRLFDKIDIRESSRNLLIKKGNITIYDCLETFSTEEKLEKDNAWYCSVCKEHQEANKKLEIFKAPHILIVQFKRFKIKSGNVFMGMMANRKNESFIDFPIENLDIRNYIVGEDKNDGIYDLFAISQHFGSLSGGHYTALCKNNNKWYNFDDDNVSRVSDNNVVSASAYLVFYRKKSLNKYKMDIE
jgi:ubiquitin carboxyl-terminal hydrolase 4/11/15